MASVEQARVNETKAVVEATEDAGGADMTEEEQDAMEQVWKTRAQ
jgi:hypothetical protein